MATKLQNLLDYSQEELETLATSLGQPRFRAAQTVYKTKSTGFF